MLAMALLSFRAWRPPPGVITLPLSDRFFYLSAFRVELLARVRGSASLRGNRLSGRATLAPGGMAGNLGLPLRRERRRAERRPFRGARGTHPLRSPQRRQQPAERRARADGPGALCRAVRRPRQPHHRPHHRQRPAAPAALDGAETSRSDQESHHAVTALAGRSHRRCPRRPPLRQPHAPLAQAGRGRPPEGQPPSGARGGHEARHERARDARADGQRPARQLRPHGRLPEGSARRGRGVPEAAGPLDGRRAEGPRRSERPAGRTAR